MYYGNVSMAGLTTSSFTVAGTPDNTPYLSPIGLAVTVLLGTGIGQVTRVVNASRDLKSWEVSPAFAVPLQEDSVISIVPFRGHCTYEGNAYLNDTTWQLFGTAFDVTGAGNYLFNTSGGMQAWGLWYQGGLQVNYGVVLDNNTLRCSGLCLFSMLASVLLCCCGNSFVFRALLFIVVQAVFGRLTSPMLRTITRAR